MEDRSSFSSNKEVKEAPYLLWRNYVSEQNIHSKRLVTDVIIDN